MPAGPSRIDPKRLRDEFLELVSIPSLSKREGAIARRLEGILKSMGGSVEVDDAGEQAGGETGNLLARFPGTKPDAPPILLSLHMDMEAGGHAHMLMLEEGWGRAFEEILRWMDPATRGGSVWRA